MTKEKIQPAIHALKEKLIQRFGAETEVYLFGSVARGDARQDSDIDILVLIVGNVNNALREEIFDLAFDVELDYNVVFGIIVRPKDYWHSKKAAVVPLHKSIQKEGIRV